LEAQRWLVRSLVDADFGLRRHEGSNAMTIVYGLSPKRSRLLHDATILEVRRQLLPATEIPATTKADLIGTRGHALWKFADQLSPSDFSKLAYFMKNLSPATLIPRPECLEWTLNGYPGAQRLFNHE
jgi:hypothetical protein